MKNRSRPFHCSIADKEVGISLRHGGGFREPEHVYVRCEERDCQYVDLNTPPCPLHVEMFADGSDRNVNEYLHAHAGTRVCYACLTDALGISHDQVRRATWRVKDEPDISIRPARCGICHQRRVTIGLMTAKGSSPLVPRVSPATEVHLAPGGVQEMNAFLRARSGFAFCIHCLARELKARPSIVRETMWALESQPGFGIRTMQCVSCLLAKAVIRHEEVSEVAAPRRLLEFLFHSPGRKFCPACLAFSTDLALAEVRRISHALEPIAVVERGTGVCGVCGRWQPVIGAAAAADSHHVDELGDVISGMVRYRGFRIDLLSFRTTEGWRPFALVKSGLGALVPSAPVIVLGLLPTKLEADELSAVTAREWIDKHVP